MELRIREGRAVLAGPGGDSAREVDPHSLAIGSDLAQALHEWARVASAVGTSGTEAASVVSQRGRQLAQRVAATMGTSVRFVDPVSGDGVVIDPPAPAPRSELARRLFGTPDPAGEPTPWLTGLTVSAFVAAVVVVAMLALANTLARETNGWLALLASAVVTAGITPSLWLSRRVPIVRWASFGAAAGIVIAWIGVLIVVF
ncbi:DUF2537 domain-containing protein [Amycolatopsis keratiniphila]|uniref:DUF2537 domain-containing protein n=1 Tax=Amycolatopsis keratiniphila subsp. keratiniphila TaxID=227715 RepID=A0A1W2LUJ8_9PSEU|nr:DUF2537 domain-containing protein [Amycolatopsis keratiniphila]OLZ52026.1 hypothetical protein BS330_25715 [Amycolatopsis keratiniphila subsp. nogabecina]ONF69685.1 hypothetical protein AVR91_0217425 [Amycolatopsis keratiniphila subsp. keratiniphila]SDU61340.1 Protein of unknown function [Amycolatopsis keratiniphila]